MLCVHKINMQKSIAFPPTRKEYPKIKIKNNSIYSIINKNKYLRVRLAKEVQSLYTENYKTLFKGSKDDLHKWNGISSSWINISQLIYRFNPITIKIPADFLQKILKFICKFKETIIIKIAIINNRVGKLTLSYYNSYEEAEDFLPELPAYPPALQIRLLPEFPVGRPALQSSDFQSAHLYEQGGN